VIATTGTGCASSTAYLSVYDPNAGFVTGGGWITSPVGAYAANPTLTGKANFGFNAQYKKGSNAVDGNTEFQFQAGNLNFKSTNYVAGTLVIAGSKAIFKGTGTINGTGTYNFIVSGIDGTYNGGTGSDKFRIKITDLSGAVVYDNNVTAPDNADPSTVLGGGSIVIHDINSKKTVTAARVDNLNVEVVPLALMAYPNPSTNKFTVSVQSNNREEKIQVRVMDLNGRVME
jgi:hypothetical protein